MTRSKRSTKKVVKFLIISLITKFTKFNNLKMSRKYNSQNFYLLKLTCYLEDHVFFSFYVLLLVVPILH